MSRALKSKPIYRIDFVKPIAAALIECGHRNVTVQQIKECLDAYIVGKRGSSLPHGIIGKWAQKAFDETEAEQPGALALLIDDIA